MKEIEKSKMIYDNIEIPKELDLMVRNAIAAAEEKRKQGTASFAEKDNICRINEKKEKEPVSEIREKKHKKKEGRRIRPFVRTGLTAAAAVMIAFTVGLNSSPAFAMEMEAHPVWGMLAKVLTIRSYHEFDQEKGIQKTVELPAIEVTGLEEEDVTEEGKSKNVAVVTNDKIQAVIDSHVAQAEADFEEYKKLFFENGGSEEEWEGRTMELDVDYEVKYQKDNLLSLVVFYSEVSAFAYEKAYYYNVDLKADREITLEDLLGSDYVSIANEQILLQMKERMEADEDLYYWGINGEEEDGIIGFSTVNEATTFYVNEKGNPVITFEEYEVAPGFMGIQEFEVIEQG